MRIERWHGSDWRTGRRRGSTEWEGLGGVGWDGDGVGWEMREMRDERDESLTDGDGVGWDGLGRQQCGLGQ